MPINAYIHGISNVTVMINAHIHGTMPLCLLLYSLQDNVIYDRLASSDPLSSITQQHLDMYANEGKKYSIWLQIL